MEEKKHILIGGTCWCKPILRKIKGQEYWFHKNEKGETALKNLNLKTN